MFSTLSPNGSPTRFQFPIYGGIEEPVPVSPTGFKKYFERNREKFVKMLSFNCSRNPMVGFPVNTTA